MWFRSIVPVEQGWLDALAGLAPAIMVKTALGALVVVFVGRVFDQASTHVLFGRPARGLKRMALVQI